MLLNRSVAVGIIHYRDCSMSLYDFGSREDQPGANYFLSQSADNRTESEKQESTLSIYNPDAPEIMSARTQADETINISGAFIKVYPRAESANYDLVWEEDADPVYLNHHKIKAFFKPANLKIELEKWGIDTSAPTEVVFSHRQLYELLGERMLRAGDVLYLPFNAASINPTHYKITNGAPSGNFRYTWLYFTCQAVVLKADATIRVDDDLQDRLQDDPSGPGFSEAY